jgi:hypothetical protein
MSAPLSFQSLVVVVTQPASCVLVCKFSPPCRPCVPAPVELLLVGVGQPLSNKPEALADVRGADARSAQICRPDGVARCFQVSAYSVEPAEAVLARNLFSKDDWRAALIDEHMKRGPEVALVGKPGFFSGGAKGLAGAGASPDRSIVGPSGETEGVGPDADACEEVALGVTVEVRSSHVAN